MLYLSIMNMISGKILSKLLYSNQPNKYWKFLHVAINSTTLTDQRIAVNIYEVDKLKIGSLPVFGSYVLVSSVAPVEVNGFLKRGFGWRLWGHARTSPRSNKRNWLGEGTPTPAAAAHPTTGIIYERNNFPDHCRLRKLLWLASASYSSFYISNLAWFQLTALSASHEYSSCEISLFKTKCNSIYFKSRETQYWRNNDIEGIIIVKQFFFSCFEAFLQLQQRGY